MIKKKKCLHLRKVLLKSTMLFRANLIRKKCQFLFKILRFIIQLSQGLHVEMEIQRRLQKKTPNLSHLWWEFSWEKRNLWTKDYCSLIQKKMWPLCPFPCHSEPPQEDCFPCLPLATFDRSVYSGRLAAAAATIFGEVTRCCHHSEHLHHPHNLLREIHD